MENTYLKDRLDDQIDWYSNKSQSNQRYFKRLKIIEIVSAAMIPFLVGYSDKFTYLQYIIGILGVSIAIIAGLLSLYKYQENWIEYRTTSETLKHQKMLYENKCPPYDDDETKFVKLVQTCESLISKENSNWTEYIKKEKKQKS